MATQSVEKDQYGPEFPLGLIAVPTPGTPVGIMSLVDSTSVNAPETQTANAGATATSYEYSPHCQQIMIQGFKAGASHGLQVNTGNVYLMRKGIQGAGNRDDYGTMVACVPAGQTLFFAASPLNRAQFGPYRYFIDADNAGDSALVTLIIG